jgi:hypothetical protein
MPYDPHADDLDDESADEGEGGLRRFREFDCPVCNANNPCDDPFKPGDEVRCFYCGQEFKALVRIDGRLKLKEL